MKYFKRIKQIWRY